MPRWETEYFCAAAQVVSETSPYEGVRTNQPAASNTKPQIILMKPKSLPLMARKSRNWLRHAVGMISRWWGEAPKPPQTQPENSARNNLNFWLGRNSRRAGYRGSGRVSA